MNCMIVFISVKNEMGILNVIALNLYIGFGKMVILPVLILPIT